MKGYNEDIVYYFNICACHDDDCNFIVRKYDGRISREQ